MYVQDWIVGECEKRIRRKNALWLISIPLAAIAAYLACGEEILGPILVLLYVPLPIVCYTLNVKLLKEMSCHPVVRKVRGWIDADQVNERVQQELQTSVFFKLGGVSITDNFVICQHPIKFDLFVLRDLAWCYRKVERVNGVPTNNSIEFRFVEGDTAALVRKKEITEVLAHCHQRVPWAFYGFDEELDKTFRKNRSLFLDQLKARKHQFAVQVLDVIEKKRASEMRDRQNL